jgi:hypothetical protein
MKYLILLIPYIPFSQEIARNTISVVGNSTATTNSYYVSQSNLWGYNPLNDSWTQKISNAFYTNHI